MSLFPASPIGRNSQSAPVGGFQEEVDEEEVDEEVDHGLAEDRAPPLPDTSDDNNNEAEVDGGGREESIGPVAETAAHIGWPLALEEIYDHDGSRAGEGAAALEREEEGGGGGEEGEGNSSGKEGEDDFAAYKESVREQEELACHQHAAAAEEATDAFPFGDSNDSFAEPVSFKEVPSMDASHSEESATDFPPQEEPSTAPSSGEEECESPRRSDDDLTCKVSTVLYIVCCMYSVLHYFRFSLSQKSCSGKT